MSGTPDRNEKIVALLKNLVADKTTFSLLRETLFDIGHSVMPRVEFMKLPEVTDPARLAAARTGIIMDTETTGLDHTSDKVIQLSMLRFTYDDQGIISLGEMFDEYQDPGIPIPDVITELTGITNEDVQGKSIDQADIKAFIGDADIVVAQNAEFDRKFVETAFPDSGFADIDWHCSVYQIDWKARGMGKSGLELLALKTGFVYNAHNARSDILATAFVLAGPPADQASFDDPAHQSVSPFSEMLATAAMAPIHLILKTDSFPGNDVIAKLKDNGYLWAPDDKPACGYKKVWHKIIPGTDEATGQEAAFLKEAFRRDKILPAFSYHPRDRYSNRPPKRIADFCTIENATRLDKLVLQEEAPVSHATQQSFNL